MASTTVVASSYNTTGNGGRKVVRLSNGWLIAGAYDSTGGYINFYKSPDGGATWSAMLCRISYGQLAGFAIASSGTTVYAITAATSGDTTAGFFKFDATTVTVGSTLTKTSSPDASQSSFGSGISLCVDGSGALHAAWVSKNTTYPNSTNIRYGKSIDDGVTWAKTQVTKVNIAGDNATNPCITLHNNIPIIMFQGVGFYWDANGSSNAGNGTSTNAIHIVKNSLAYTGSNYIDTAWRATTIFYLNGGVYSQQNPCVAVDGNDNIHVVWHGTDLTESGAYNIRYSRSLDGGITWKKADGTAGHDKLTSGNTNYQQYPSITLDNNNNIYVLFTGKASGTYNQIRKIEFKNNVWNSIVDLTTNTTNHASHPQTLWSKFNMNSSDAMRWIYLDNQAPAAVKYDSIKLLWSHKLLGVNTPSKIMGINPSKVMGVA